MISFLNFLKSLASLELGEAGPIGRANFQAIATKAFFDIVNDMKKLIICGSISAAGEILATKTALEEKGFEVEIPEGVKHLDEWEGEHADVSEKAERKMKHDLIRGYYEKMKECDLVLIVNPEKKGIPGYIGGNTLIEMAFAHVLHKPLYVLHRLPEMPYTSEILAMRPIALDGDIDKLG